MDHALVVIVLIVIYGLSLFAFPTKACGSCARSRGPCSRCGGTGRRFRLGARLVHHGAAQARKQARKRT